MVGRKIVVPACGHSPAMLASPPPSAHCTIVRRMLGRSLSSQGKPLSRVQHSSSGSAVQLASPQCNICSPGAWPSRRTSCVVAKLASLRSQNVSATVPPVRSASPSLAMLATRLRNTLARMRPRTPFIPGWRRGLLAPLERALPYWFLGLADAAIGHQIRTRHVGTLVGGEEECRAGNLLSPSESTDRDHALVHLHQLLAWRRL